MQTLAAIFKQTFWQIIGKVVSSISTLIILGVVARNYQESGTGIFTLALTFLAMFNLLSDFGFNAHELRNNKIEWQKLLGTRILWSIVLMILALGILPFGIKELALAVFFGSLAILGSAIFITCNLLFQSKHRYDLSVLASSLGSVVGLIFYFWLSALRLPVAVLLIANSITWIIIALSSLILVKRFLKSFLPIYSIPYTLYLFKSSWPIAATLALNVVYFRADSFILLFFKGLSEVGVYNTAYSVFQSALVLPAFIMNAYYPLMLKARQKIRQVAILLAGLAIFAMLITYLFSPQVIYLLTGKGFAGSSQSLQILSFSFPAFFLSSLLMWLLISMGQYKKILLIYATGLVFNLVLNFIYIPLYSFSAASWITVFCEYLILTLLAVSLLR